MADNLYINISFEINTRHDHSTLYGSFAHPDLDGLVYGKNEAQIKTKLKTKALEQITDGLRTRKNPQQCIIGCVDGTVLVVHYRYGSWGYSFAGPGHTGASCCVSSGCFDSVTSDAKRHAEQSYGGVAWESTL